MAGDIRSELDLDITAALAQVHRLEQAASRALALDVNPRGLEQAAKAARKVDDGLHDAVGEAKQLDDRAGKIGSSLKKLAVLVGGTAVLRGLKAVIDVASDLEESTSKAATVFGDSFARVEQFADSAATSVGLAKDQALEAAGTFGNLFTATGLARGAAADMSVGIVQLAADLASFNNLEVSEATEKLRAGLVGEAEPLRTLGINITAAATKAKALELGLLDVNGEMDTAAKLQANYALILEQSTTAQGDFARTSGGLANQQRILASEVRNLAGELGTQLLPLALELVTAIRNDLIPAARAAGPALASIAAAGGRGALTLLASLLDVLVAFTPVLNAVSEVLERIPPDLLAMGIAAGGAVKIVRDLNRSMAAGSIDVTTFSGKLARGAGLAGAFLLVASAAGEAADSVAEALGHVRPDTNIQDLTNDLRKLADGVQVVARQFEGLADPSFGIENLGDAIGRITSPSVTNRIADTTDTLTSLLSVGLLGNSGGARGLRSSQEALNELDRALTDVARNDGAQAALDALDALARQEGLTAEQTAVLTSLLPELNVQLDTMGIDAGKAAKATRDAAGGIEEIESASDKAERRVDALSQALDTLIGSSISVDKATINFEDSLDDLTAAVEENRKGITSTTDLLDFTNDSVREVTGAFQDSAEAIIAQAKASADADVPLGQINRTLRAQIDALIAAAGAAGLNKAEIAKLVDQYGLIPELIATEVQTIYTTKGSKPTTHRTIDDRVKRNLAAGGIIEPTPGGHLVRIGEAGSREVVVPTDDPRRALHLLTTSGVLDVAARAVPAVGGQSAFAEAGQRGPLIGQLTVVGADSPQQTSRKVVRDLRDEVWLQDGSIFGEAI